MAKFSKMSKQEALQEFQWTHRGMVAKHHSNYKLSNKLFFLNFTFPYFRACMGRHRNVFCWVHSHKWTDHTCSDEEAENHGHWEGSPWFSEQVSAAHTTFSTRITALFATFLFYVLECSEHYLLPQFPGYCGVPSLEWSNHLLFLYLHVDYL